MLVHKKLLEQLIELATESAEYLNEKWITVKPHGDDSKGVHIKVEDGETNKEAIDRKFGHGKDEKKEESKYNLDKKNTGKMWKGETWGKIFDNITKRTSGDVYIEKEEVDKYPDSLFSDEKVFSHYKISDGRWSQKIPAEYNDYIKEKFIDEKYIYKLKK